MVNSDERAGGMEVTRPSHVVPASSRICWASVSPRRGTAAPKWLQEVLVYLRDLDEAQQVPAVAVGSGTCHFNLDRPAGFALIGKAHFVARDWSLEIDPAHPSDVRSQRPFVR